MKLFKIFALLACACWLVVPVHGAVINGDFETDAVGGVDSWTHVTLSGATITHSTVQPHTGLRHVEAHMISPSGSTGTAGVRQDGLAVSPGVDYQLRSHIRLPDGESLMPNAPFYTGTSIVTSILWKDASNNSLGQNYLFLTTEVTDVYQPFDVVATAPASAATASVFLYLQSGGFGGIDQTAYFDDVSFTAEVIPEPSSLLLTTLFGVGCSCGDLRISV